jgi:ATP-dependent DNA ligase
MGEGYNPKAEFLHQITEILTVTKKNKDITPELLALSEKVCECWLFDGYGFDNIDENTNWMKRREAVKKLVKGYKYVYVLPYKTANNKAELDIALAENKTRGGEGLMVRWKNCEIKHGKSKYLLKLKHWEDEEFELVDFALGNGNWSTFPKKAIFKLPEPCKDRDGNILTTFASNIEGGEEYLAKLWKDRKDLIGKKFTVKYQLKSAYGIPQIPWLIVPRTYE